MCSDTKYRNGIVVSFKCEIMISECSARALDGLVGYGDKEFIEAFKEKLGTHYIRDHEDGLIEFFSQVRKNVLPQIYRINEMRDAINAPDASP